MTQEEILPLIVMDSEGTVLRMLRCNEKGCAKSIERGEVWHLHDDTGRLLPLEGGGVAFTTFRRNLDWYEVRLPLSSDEETAAKENSTLEQEARLPEESGSSIIRELEALITRRKEELPEGSYTTHLFSKGNEKIRKKTGEEAVELILAHKREEIVYEASDLIYHLLVLLADEGISFSELEAELARRHAPE